LEVGNLPSTTPDRLPLRALRFGKVDARYEVNTRDPRDIAHFRHSFVEPAGMKTEEFINGYRFFVHGVKGAGKTSFLRYIQLIVSEEHSITRFISFSTEISDAEREKIQGMSDISIFEQNDASAGFNSVEIWMIFILRQIAKLIEQNQSLFNTHKNITIFCKLMRKFYDQEEDKGLLVWLSKALKNGKYKLKSKHLDADLKGPDGDIEHEFSADFIIDQALTMLKDLSWEGFNSIFLFFDEINLSFASRATHKRDIILIRDLIIAIDRLNMFFIEEHKPIFILAAARSEVLHALNAPTHEINKILADRGRELRWFAKTGGEEWPITKLLAKKIIASEKLLGIHTNSDVFIKYFYRDIFGFSPRDFVIETTWCNPRDLVLLFGEAASQSHSSESVFGTQNITRVIDNYSTSAWLEKSEELSVEYAPQEIQSIKKGLLNFYRHFRSSNFEKNWEHKAESDKIMRMMMTKFEFSKILEDLYRVGILGQSTREPRDESKSFTQHWAYRGDNTFDSSAWLIVHKALWPELRLGRPRGETETRK
jgi:hypothetical protein